MDHAIHPGSLDKVTGRRVDEGLVDDLVSRAYHRPWPMRQTTANTKLLNNNNKDSAKRLVNDTTNLLSLDDLHARLCCPRGLGGDGCVYAQNAACVQSRPVRKQTTSKAIFRGNLVSHDCTPNYIHTSIHCRPSLASSACVKRVCSVARSVCCSVRVASCHQAEGYSARALRPATTLLLFPDLHFERTVFDYHRDCSCGLSAFSPEREALLAVVRLRIQEMA
jgi:hypothetical protein